MSARERFALLESVLDAARANIDPLGSSGATASRLRLAASPCHYRIAFAAAPLRGGPPSADQVARFWKNFCTFRDVAIVA